ncbi:kinase-like domain-containing protein [Pelagophyceae sp. CCMP2097]|nr:kinase-like domain-containing protein [Pelagophyceae sp. CCMP2097]|mmetsp:Transcript_13908/g.48407  ORF Transcript_13908/g.48407 Transcript_13908/m.48407 type:complete len:350 (+) Transcript_13908:187-1236(+)
MGLLFKKKEKPRLGGNPAASAGAVVREQRKFTLSEFEIFDTLGTGTFGRVRLVRHIEEGDYYALKIVKKMNIIRMNQVAHIKSETRLLRSVRHPFIVDLRSSFQDELRLYILMEYVIGGELYALLRNAGTLGDGTARFYAAEVVLALQYLHGLDIAYRSLKPENLLVDAGGHIKLADFGMAKVVPDRTYTLCGTPEYCAPEVVANAGHGRSVDWWGLGILIFEMLVGHAPFFDETSFGIYEKILLGKYETPQSLDGRAKDCIKKLLQVDRTKRLGCVEAGADAVKTHGWFARVDWDAVYHRQCEAPHRPQVAGPGDASHFDKYPDSEPGVEEPLGGRAHDLFRDFEAND